LKYVKNEIGLLGDMYRHIPVTSIKFVNCKFRKEIVIARSETTCLLANTHRQAKQSKSTLVGLLHFVRNDTIYIPLPSIPSRQWEGKLKDISHS
jgi:hypothetical protein